MNSYEHGELAFLSPNGQRLAFGHHEVFVIDDLDTGVERFVCPGYCADWISDSMVGVSRNVTLPDGSPGRQLVYVNVDTLVETVSHVDPYQQPGYQPREAVAVDSPVVSSQHEGQHFIAGQQAAWTEPTAARIECRDAANYLYKLREGDPWPVIVRGFDGQLTARIGLPLMNCRLDRLSAGTWVSGNLNGRMFVQAPWGTRLLGPAGESRGLVFEWSGEVHAVTGNIEADENGTPVPVWIVRRLNDWTSTSPARVIRGIGLEGMSVRVRGDELLCIGYVEAFQGRLSYDTLDLAQPWEPYVPVIAAPVRPTLPAPPSSMPALWIGGCAPPDVRVPGNISWSSGYTGDTRPVCEGSAYQDLVTGRTLVFPLWLSDNMNPPETVDAEIAYAKQEGVTQVYLHEDDIAHRHNVIAAAVRVRAAGLVPIYGLHVNHGRPDHLWPDESRGITINVRTVNKDMARLAEGVEWAVSRHQNGYLKAALVFGWEHCDWPELKAYLTAVCAVTPTPEIDRPSIPVTRPDPVVIHGKSNKKPDKHQEIATASIGIGAIVAVLIRWWPWKKKHNDKEAA